ncbi:MAG: formyltetrahydrofolate deformylase [Spirochaetes bacterium]|nr:formyltetrahydrofolate deformylase [Spirochaetota bacterium]MBN2772283.1 formyltetrahydrofolate deformylase [Spirochaetota bacterium]
MNTHRLLIDCTDNVGLVNKITGVLANHGVNILENDEFVEKDQNHFFMRTEFTGLFDSGKLYSDLSTLLPKNSIINLTGKRKKNIIVMVTKEHHCLGDVLIRHAFGDLDANILAIISNHQNLRELSERMNIPFHYISHENLSREEHEEMVIKQVNQYSPEYIVLAKYMRILTPAFTSLYPNRIINIHHSFLPAFIGANPYKQAFKRGVKIIGATAHFVNHELDEGPIIAQDVVSVNHTNSAEEMARKGRDVEKIVLSRALALVFEDRVMVNGNKTIVFE